MKGCTVIIPDSAYEAYIGEAVSEPRLRAEHYKTLISRQLYVLGTYARSGGGEKAYSISLDPDSGSSPHEINCFLTFSTLRAFQSAHGFRAYIPIKGSELFQIASDYKLRIHVNLDTNFVLESQDLDVIMREMPNTRIAPINSVEESTFETIPQAECDSLMSLIGDFGLSENKVLSIARVKDSKTILFLFDREQPLEALVGLYWLLSDYCREAVAFRYFDEPVFAPLAPGALA